MARSQLITWLVPILEVLIIVGLIYFIYRTYTNWKEYEGLESFGCPKYICKGPYAETSNEYRAYHTLGGNVAFQISDSSDLTSA